VVSAADPQSKYLERQQEIDFGFTHNLTPLVSEYLISRPVPKTVLYKRTYKNYIFQLFFVGSKLRPSRRKEEGRLRMGKRERGVVDRRKWERQRRTHAGKLSSAYTTAALDAT
jgi:hypothetical protein